MAMLQSRVPDSWGTSMKNLGIVISKCDYGVYGMPIKLEKRHGLKLVGKDLDEYSLDTVKMFHDDAASAGFALEPAQVSG